MRILRYLKESKLAVLAIVLLLIVQAFTDLSLPRYTADIVDVGIQQSGVDRVAPQEMRAETLEGVCMLLDDADEQKVRGSYAATEEGTYVREEAEGADPATLDALMAEPLALIHFSSESSDVDFSQALQAYEAGAITKDQIQDAVAEAKAGMGDIGESIIEQQAVLATKAEYEALGMDLGALQMNYLLKVGAIMLGLTVLGSVVAALIGLIASRTSAKVGRTLRDSLYKKVVSFSDAEVQSFSAASLITRGTNDIQQIQMVTVMFLRMVLYSPILAIGGIFMVSQTNPAMSWIIVLAVIIIAILIAALMALALPKFKLVQKLIDGVNLVSREILTGLPVIRAFNRQGFEEQRFDDASDSLRRTQLFTNRVMAFMMPTMMLVMNGVSVLVVWVGGSYIDNGTIQTGDMIAFITYSMVIIMSFLIIGMMSVMLPRADVAAQRVNEVLATETSILDPAVSEDGKIPATGGARISFNDVSFRYADSKECILEQVDFTAEAGETCAIIGSTGSGKSTVIKLIERFYDVTEGSVTLDGVDIRNLSQSELRKNLGYVPQKAFLFTGTIGSNIAYGDPDMAEGTIEQAARIAQATDFIEGKEEGLESDISQGGTNVSGGQRQRLAIARALATDARVLLFDDSFSALDYKTDAALREALASQVGDKTVIIVAQRISTVMNADQIIVLEEGRVVGKGTHEELMDGCETYREIALSQLSLAELTGGDAA